MNTKSARTELKQFSVALASMMAKLGRNYSDADRVSLSLGAASDGCCSFYVTVESDGEFRSVVNMFCPDVMKGQWMECEEFSGKYDFLRNGGAQA